MIKALVLSMTVTTMLAAPPLTVHEHFRIIGTITRLVATELDVKNKEGKTYTVDVNKKTVVKRDKEKAELDLSALKVGQSVVVDAYGDDEFDLEAQDIRIVPPLK